MRDVPHYRFSEVNKSKSAVQIPNKITIPADMYKFMYFRFLENNDRSSKTRQVIVGGASDGDALWVNA